MDHAFTGWIDVPVVQAIEYFSGVMATFYKWGSHYAVAIGTIGLCWSAFKLANSRQVILSSLAVTVLGIAAGDYVAVLLASACRPEDSQQYQ